MSDVNANIGVNFDTSQALAELKNLQRQLSQFHTSISRTSESAALAQRNLQTNLLNSVNATGNFIAQMGVIKTSTESFTHALENNKLSMREYFRYAGGASQTFGRLFTNEFNTIGKVAEERVKKLQTQYIKMGRDTTGAMRAMSVMPATLDMSNIATKTQIAAQKQAIFNQLLKQGSTQLLNFGKNTQWAGRQLMVGFTVPLIAFGSAATKAFTDIETASIKFKKVYGDLGTTQAETTAVLAQIRALADGYTQYGVAVKDTISLAADAAAAGYQNANLVAQTTAATKLSVLGQIDSQQSLKTTISLQSAFGISAEKLTGTIDFLNAVENQTVLSLDDITTAIPLVSPVIKQLGGNVQDLTFFLTAMKEGGVTAAQGANALKSGLASLINPSTKASSMLKGLGIDIRGIVQKDQGDLKKTVLDIAKALDTLDPLTRARAIETMFGKFQFARMSTLFQNITKDGSQASRVLDLMGMSASDLATISQKELGVQGASALTKFKGAIEKLKASIAPVGEMFMKIFTPVIETVGKVLDKFNHLSDGAKKAIAIIVAVIGGLGPIALMTFGLLANAFANGIKLFATLRAGYQKLTGNSKDLGEQTQYLTMEQLDAAAAAHSLDQSHAKLTQTFTAEAGAVNTLRNAYSRAAVAAEAFRIANPGMMTMPGKKFATGGIVSGPGTGTSDSIPAMLSNGEAVIPAAQTKKYGGLINGIIAGNIPGFMSGRSVAYAHAQMPFAPGSAEYAKGIQIAGLEKLAAAFPEFIKVVSNLVIELPQDLNVAMKKGVDALKFASDYNARQGKTITTAKLGGLDTSNPQNMIALQALEDEIGQATIQLAEQKAAGGKVVVSDEMFAEATRGVIDKYKVVEGAAGEAARALDASSKQVGQVRVSAKKDQLIAGLESGQFVRSRTGNQSQNQIMYEGVNIARESSSTPNSFYSGNPISPTGSYKGKAKRAVMVATKEILDEVVDGVVTEAQIKSPSRKARVAGQEIAKGGIAGIVDEVKNARAAGQRLGSAATTGVIAGGGMGGGLIPPTGGSNGGNGGGTGGDSPSSKKTPINLERMNNALMGATFGLTTIASVGSMAGGAIGNLSGQVMKYSGLLFGLMSITQLLTQTSVLKLASDRAAVAANLASGSTTGIKGLLAGSNGFKEKLFTVGRFLGEFGGKLGLAGLAIGAAVIAFKLISAANERSRQKIEGLGKAANISAGQISKLGGAFGVNPFKGALESFKPQVIVSTQQRSLITQARDALSGDKTYQNDVKALSGANTQQSKQILQARATKLLGAGFAQDQVQAIIQAMEEDAGKVNLKFEVKSIDLTTKEGKAGLKSSVDSIIKDYQTAFEKGYKAETRYIDNSATHTAPTAVITRSMTNDLKTKLATTKETLSAFIIGINDQFQSGKISAADFTGSFDTLNTALNNLTSSQAATLMPQLLASINSDLPKAAAGVSSLKDQMLLLQAAMSGIGGKELADFIAALKVIEDTKSSDGAKAAAIKTIDTVKAKMAANTKEQESKNKATTATTTDTTGTTTKTPLQLGNEQLKQQRLEIKNSIASYNLLRKANMSVADASKVAGDAVLAAALMSVKVGTPAYKQLIATLKAWTAEQKVQQDKQTVKDLSIKTTAINDQVSALKALTQNGMSAADALQTVSDANMTQLINDTVAAKGDMKGLAENIKKSIDLQATLDGMGVSDQQKQHDAIIKQADSAIQVLQDRAAIIQAESDAQQKTDQATIDIIQKRIDDNQKIIDGFQQTIDANNHSVDLLNHTMDMTIDRPIAKLQAESDILSNNLTIIDHQTQLVNDQYDKQAAALDLVNKANQDAISIGKQKISIADALASGDISAAAQAVQDLRAQQAASQSGAMQAAMDAARKNAVDNITAGGMTKTQIEQRQYEISQQTYALEQQRKDIQAQIQTINDANYTLEQNIYNVKSQTIDKDTILLKSAQDQLKTNSDSYQKQIDTLNIDGLTITAWENIKKNADLAYDTFINVEKTTTASKDAAAALKKTFDDLTKNPPHFNSYESHYITNYVTTVSSGSTDTSSSSSSSSPTGSSSSSTSTAAPATKTLVPGTGMYLGSLFIPPQYKANGGMIRYFAGGGAAKGSDTVPAMLTPGEFVVNKAAAQAYRPLLESINRSTYPNMNKFDSAKTPTTANLSNVVTDNSRIAYNYSLSVNMNGSNQDPNDVANAVLVKIRQLENQKVKGQVKY